ncbi:DUF6292 family protein [Nonomuraea endophytica]|uniref:DUF6292 domain-containing protein n=1 Tax=Nonomuraea endophytica TaxID=714136 RepID=A0A7W8A8U4_9ACTN|nr:DUF6292 family protein [Nonomuraea endophytica]MBB5080810.1 hypothetical protein [Nonomuraea endophytica]
MPVPYSQEWLRLPLGYVSSVAAAVEHVMWWDDPFDPRDATILLAGGDALVWDEESGWRRGRFVSGERGVRTVLAGVRYLGGGVLPEPAEVVGLMARGGGRTRVVYRSFRDLHDGFDARLARHALV